MVGTWAWNRGLDLGKTITNNFPRIRREVLASERSRVNRSGSVRVALLWPGSYETGMSNLGFLWVYDQLNRAGISVCDRFFHQIGPMEFSSYPPLSLEEGLTLGQYELIAISIAAEVQLVPLIRMLDAAQVPIMAAERRGFPPIVIGGALTRSNPSLVAGIGDVLVWGDGEDGIEGLVQALEQGVLDPGGLQQAMAARDGVVPPGSCFEPWNPARARNPQPLVSRITCPGTTFGDMVLAEVVRGCPRACGFCVCSRISSPMRHFPWTAVRDALPPDQDRFGFLGAGIGDYPDLVPLLEWVASRGATAGVSSLRADRLSLDLARALFHAGSRSATLALDGSSQRIRDSISKGISRDQFIVAVENLKKAGMTGVKVYAMFGLPGEEDSDLLELGDLIAEARRIMPLTLALSPFVPKKGTPLANARFAPLQELTRSLGIIRAALPRGQKTSQVSPREAWVEYVLSQASEQDLEKVIEVARGRASYRDWGAAFPSRVC